MKGYNKTIKFYFEKGDIKAENKIVVLIFALIVVQKWILD